MKEPRKRRHPVGRLVDIESVQLPVRSPHLHPESPTLHRLGNRHVARDHRHGGGARAVSIAVEGKIPLVRHQADRQPGIRLIHRTAVYGELAKGYPRNGSPLGLQYVSIAISSDAKHSDGASRSSLSAWPLRPTWLRACRASCIDMRRSTPTPRHCCPQNSNVQPTYSTGPAVGPPGKSLLIRARWMLRP